MPPVQQSAVLLIDDDEALAATLSRLLLMDGFLLEAAHRGAEGLTQALSGRFSLVLLDVMLPDSDGRTLLKRIRETSDVPIIMLTARGEDADRIHGLESGADDFVAKPFNPRELVARMRAVLKRQRSVATPGGMLQVGDLTLRPATRTALLNGKALTLTGAEYDVLCCLVRSAGSIVSRDQLAEAALGRSLGVFDRSVDNHVSNVRRKLGPRPSGEERIGSVRGAGYTYLGELSDERAFEQSMAEPT